MTQRTAIGFGTGLALLTVIVLEWLPLAQAHDMLAMLLVFIAAVYIGFALADGERHNLLIEISGVVGFGLCAVLGLWWNAWWLVVGYLAHGIWDVIHHPQGIHTPTPQGYAPFCLVYDWLMSAYLIYWLLAHPM